MLWARSLTSLVLSVVFILLFECGLGCRYNVRETGFVDAGIRSLVVVCCIDEKTPTGFGEVFLREAETILASSTLTYELVNIDLQPDHPALNYLSVQTRRKLPTLVLVSREGSSLEVPLSLDQEDAGVVLKKALVQIVETPFRKRLGENLAKHYGVVLLVDGQNDEQNERAVQSIQSAVEAIKGQMRFMPKPIRYGPLLMRLDFKKLSEESSLLWALGVEDPPGSDPHCAVVYGKGRLLGPVLQGPEIEEGILLRLLAIVGADCECGLDPRLIRGRPLPLKWARSLYEAVVEDLGFDPENPLVRIEVEHILRMRESLYPTALSDPSQTRVDELPVPLVDDSASGSMVFDPIIMNVLYSVTGLGLLVLGIGFLILRRARRKG